MGNLKKHSVLVEKRIQTMRSILGSRFRGCVSAAAAADHRAVPSGVFAGRQVPLGHACRCSASACRIHLSLLCFRLLLLCFARWSSLAGIREEFWYDLIFWYDSRIWYFCIFWFKFLHVCCLCVQCSFWGRQPNSPRYVVLPMLAWLSALVLYCVFTEWTEFELKTKISIQGM